MIETTNAVIPTEEKPPVGSIEGKPGVTVITQENFKEYVDEKLGVKPAEEVNEDPEAIAAAEAARIEEEKKAKGTAAKAPKEGDIDGSKVFFKGKWVGKQDFGYRLHIQTEAKAKEADTKIATAEAKAKTEREAREAAERREADLKAKYEPPKGELGPEPQAKDFTEIAEYSKALKEWQGEKTIREYEQKQSQESQTREAEAKAKAWNERQAAVKIELRDYEEKLAASSVKISNEMRDAIIESELGPKILYHFAEHPEVAEAMGKMTIGRMLREFGKLEATLGSQAKPTPKSEGTTAVAEISQAPTPITPLKGVNAPVGTLRGADEVPKGMTYDQWKALYKAGKIKDFQPGGSNNA